MKARLFNESVILENSVDDLRRLSLPLRWAASFFGLLRRKASERALRRHLADLDDVLLKDIGVADDEIVRVRRMECFTPRAWLG
jgi:uncharacterized protein YjiS (DUF1127 family)